MDRSGSDFLQLDPGDAPARGRAGWLAARIRLAVLQGRLGSGDLVPATRVLAAELGWSRGVVVEAYQRLREEGLVTGNSRGGTRVGFTGSTRTTPRSATPTVPEAVVDLSPGVPDLTRFPAAAWLRAEREVLADDPARTLRYGEPSGELVFRRGLASWLGVQRGLDVVPEDVLVVSGVAQTLALVAHVLHRGGLREILVEDPGSRGAREELSYWGLEPVPVPVGGEGLRVDLLPRAPRGPGADGFARVVLVTPAHQYPTGVPLSPRRRRALLDWARDHDALIVEDDYDAEHRYDRTPVPSLHVGAPERIVHTGSVSKTLAPALRLGWSIAPAGLRDRLLEAKFASDISSPALPQLTMAALLADGSYERHLRTSRRHQRRRRDALVDAVHRHLPDARVVGVAAGLHVLVTFDGRRFDDVAVARRIRARGIVVEPLSPHRSADGPPGLILGYAPHPADRLEDAVAWIAKFLRE